MRNPTARSYLQDLQRLQDFLGPELVESLEAEALDAIVSEFFETLYFDGFNHDQAEKTLAAVLYVRPELRGSRRLPRAAMSLRGFRRLAPGLSRAPLPVVALMALVGAALADGRARLATALLIQFFCYLRPAELVKLRVKDLVAPVAGSGCQVWALLLAPAELGITSKTNEFDESVLLDGTIAELVGPFLRSLKAGRAPDEPLFAFDGAYYAQSFARLAEVSGVVALQPHPYSLRHGGASFDALHNLRDLASIKKRGRWRSDASVRRYEKHARALSEAARLPPRVRAFGEAVRRTLPGALLRPGLAPQLPALRRLVSRAPP